jgi:TP901 family phage tail tape measure protein
MSESVLNLLIKATDGASGVMGKIKGEVEKLEKATKNLARDGFEKLRSDGEIMAKSLVFGTATAVGFAIALAGIGFNNATNIQDAMADVQKSAGLTSQEVGGLRDEILDLSTTTQTQTLDLIGIAKIGGQIGVAKNELLDFTASIDKVSTALGDEFTGGAEEVSSKLGTLRNLFADTANLKYGDAMLKIGSAINSLGASGTATGPVVAEFATRMGQLGNMGPSVTQTLGLGAAMQELGLSAEISSGGLTNIFLTAGRRSTDFAKQLGMTEKAFQDLYKASPNDMLLQLADSFKGIANDPVQLAEKMEELGLSSQESVKVMSLLANKTEMVRDKQALAAREFEKGTSIIDEYNIKNNTFSAIMGKARNLFTKFSSALWNANLGAIGDQFQKILDGVQPLIDLVFKGDYTGGLQTAFGWAEDSEIVIKILDLRDGVKDLTQKLKDFAQNSQVSKFIQDFVRDADKMWSIFVGISAALGAGIIAGFVSLGVAVLVAAWPFLLIAGLVGGLFYLFQTNESVRNFLTNVWNKLVEGFNYLKDVVLPQLITLWETKLQPMMAFLGQLIMTQLWPALQELWGKLMELWVLVEPYVIPALQFLAVVLGVALYISIVWLIAALTLLAKGLSWMVDQWKRQVVEFNERWDRAKDAIEFFKNKGMEAFVKVQHGIYVMSRVVKNKIGEIVDNVNGAITSFNNLGNAIEKASGGAINVTDVSTISAPGRASGGRVEAGNLYEVGENDKAELFKMGNRQYMIPGNNGDVLNQSQIPTQSTSEGQKTTINLTFAPVVNSSNMDEQSLFEMFENWLAEKNLLTSLTGV